MNSVLSNVYMVVRIKEGLDLGVSLQNAGFHLGGEARGSFPLKALNFPPPPQKEPIDESKETESHGVPLSFPPKPNF